MRHLCKAEEKKKISELDSSTKTCLWCGIVWSQFGQFRCSQRTNRDKVTCTLRQGLFFLSRKTLYCLLSVQAHICITATHWVLQLCSGAKIKKNLLICLLNSTQLNLKSFLMPGVCFNETDKWNKVLVKHVNDLHIKSVLIKGARSFKYPGPWRAMNALTLLNCHIYTHLCPEEAKMRGKKWGIHSCGCNWMAECAGHIGKRQHVI